MRTYPARPVVGVGAVILDGDRVVLVERAHEPLKGEWSLPGGAVEVGETLEAALAREVVEETGLAVAIGPIIEVVERIDVDADGGVEFHFVIVDYLCRPSGGTALAAGSDASNARWVSEADLASYKLTEKAAAVIRRGRELADANLRSLDPYSLDPRHRK